MSLENGSENGESKRRQLKRVYEAVNDVTRPGDVVFFVSERPEVESLSMLKHLYRRWQGFVDEDRTAWHTTMYTQARKQSRGSSVRPYVIHAINKGVEEIFIPPSFFINERSEDGDVTQHGRIEIVQDPDLSDDQRMELVRYAQEKLGKPFAELDWRHDILTYAFGIPAKPLASGKVSCHGLIFDAYQHVGYTFSHQLDNAPWFNVGKYLGHPIGEDPTNIDPNRLYLHDHHLYRDPRFICILSVFEDGQSGEICTVENPGKYSWNLALQQKYGV